MTPLEPALFALTIFTVFGAVAWSVPRLAAWLEGFDRREALRLAATGWSVGQIANKQCRHPEQIIEWLVQADRQRAP